MPSLMTLVVMFAKFYCTNHGHKELGLCRQAQAGRGGVVKTVPTRAGQELANLNVSNKKIRVDRRPSPHPAMQSPTQCQEN